MDLNVGLKKFSALPVELSGQLGSEVPGPSLITAEVAFITGRIIFIEIYFDSYP